MNSPIREYDLIGARRESRAGPENQRDVGFVQRVVVLRRDDSSGHNQDVTENRESIRRTNHFLINTISVNEIN